MKKIILLLSFIVSSNLQAQLTYVPDNNFEQALIDLGYDDVLDDYVLTANINTVNALDIQYKNINNLTGIEDFVALDTLSCSENHIIALDLSSNTNLIYLNCYSNQITNLNINNCNLLTYLDFSNNNITNIDISSNTQLKVILGSSNNLNAIDVSNQTELETLSLSFNQLNQIDISNNPNLIELRIALNNLTAIDISNKPNLLYLNIANNQIRVLDTSNSPLDALECHHNQITELDLTNNPLHLLLCQNNHLRLLDIRNGFNDNMIEMDARGNPQLTCVFVDDINLANPSFWHIDATATFVTTETECNNLSLLENKISEINIAPNPIKHSFTINHTKINKVILYNMQGVKIKEFNQQENYNINELKNGIYLLKIIKNNRYGFIKIIKN